MKVRVLECWGLVMDTLLYHSIKTWQLGSQGCYLTKPSPVTGSAQAWLLDSSGLVKEVLLYQSIH